jgi:flagellar biosynthesis anti-sigma factor FlgM
MKVDSRALSAYQSSLNLRPANSVGAQGQKGVSNDAPQASKEDARVTISAEARQLAAGAAAGSAASAASPSASSGVDQAKVAALKEKIANGTMNVDSQTVAARIVDRTG